MVNQMLFAVTKYRQLAVHFLLAGIPGGELPVALRRSDKERDGSWVRAVPPNRTILDFLDGDEQFDQALFLTGSGFPQQADAIGTCEATFEHREVANQGVHPRFGRPSWSARPRLNLIFAAVVPKIVEAPAASRFHRTITKRLYTPLAPGYNKNIIRQFSGPSWPGSKRGPDPMPKQSDTGNVKKACDCGRTKWSTCSHPWYVDYKAPKDHARRPNERYRKNLDLVAGKHANNLREAQDEARRAITAWLDGRDAKALQPCDRPTLAAALKEYTDRPTAAKNDALQVKPL